MPRRMRLLHRFRQYFAARDLVVGAVIGDFRLGPDPRQDLGKLLPHAARVLQIGAVRDELIGIAGAANPDINPAAAQYVERCHALRDMQRVVDRRQHHADAETDPAGALAHRREREIRRAVVRPHRAEVMLGEPHAGKTL